MFCISAFLEFINLSKFLCKGIPHNFLSSLNRPDTDSQNRSYRIAGHCSDHGDHEHLAEQINAIDAGIITSGFGRDRISIHSFQIEIQF